MDNEEMHEMTFNILVKVAPDLTNDELSLLAWHCGVSYREVVDASEEDMEPSKRRHFMEDAQDFADSLKER